MRWMCEGISFVLIGRRRCNIPGFKYVNDDGKKTKYVWNNVKRADRWFKKYGRCNVRTKHNNRIIIKVVFVCRERVSFLYLCKYQMHFRIGHIQTMCCAHLNTQSAWSPGSTHGFRDMGIKLQLNNKYVKHVTIPLVRKSTQQSIYKQIPLG